MTVGIAYSPGCYGTYLEWCLTMLTSTDKISAPFSSNGNSHKFGGNLIENIFDQKNISDLTKNLNFFRVHPKYKKEHSLINNLTNLCSATSSLIHLYPDKSSVLLCINNIQSKIYNDWWTLLFDSHTIDQNEIYENWPVNPDVKINQVPRWIQREFLSFYLMPAWFDQTEWYLPDCWQHDKCLVITVHELLWNFENSLVRCRDFCDLDYVRPVSDLFEFHRQNLQNQLYLDEDVLCNNIVTATTGVEDFSWLPRSLVSEAWIQWQLRNLGYEVRCHELDTFPTNSVHLRELIYPV
jgi:hypothetical protein